VPYDLRTEPTTARKCIHTKNIYSLLDMPAKDETYKNLSKHIESCPVCSLEFKKFQSKSSEAKVFIPKAIMDHDLRQSFDREVGELFKVMNLNEREALKRNVKKGIKTIDQMGIDFLKTLSSKSMIKIYAVAVGMFFVLKHFL
jgi:hypothetical protein